MFGISEIGRRLEEVETQLFKMGRVENYQDNFLTTGFFNSLRLDYQEKLNNISLRVSALYDHLGLEYQDKCTEKLPKVVKRVVKK